MSPTRFMDPEPSRGKGLGQQTGGSAESDAQQFREILKMIANGQTGIRGRCMAALSEKDFRFLEEQIDRYNQTVTHWSVTGKQLFYLRDIKDKLVEAGVL